MMRISPSVAIVLEISALSVISGAVIGYLMHGPDIGPVTYVTQGAVTGLIISTFIMLFEWLLRLHRVANVLRHLPFLPFIFFKALFYLAAIMLGLAIGAVLFLGSVLTISIKLLVISFAVSLAIPLAMAINGLLGKGVLLKFIVGRYHSPLLEERIFLFLDLEGSTAIAERIGPLAFHRLLNRFISDVTDPVMAWRGEIYKYVGDEMIITWTAESGLRDARCLRACFDAHAALGALADEYDQEFGVRPRFRAGMHCGVSVTGEMGTFRQEIAYLGDVVNTTARIQQACRDVGHWFLVSRALIDRLRLPEGISAESVGEIPLRGKKEVIELFALESKK